ncbi:DUF5372 family protein [Myxococcota bacterium]
MVVTRRHHPLRGQRFEVLQCGREQLTVRLKDGTTMRIPRHWTDADGDTPADERESVWTADSLRRLIELVGIFSGR